MGRKRSWSLGLEGTERKHANMNKVKKNGWVEISGGGIINFSSCRREKTRGFALSAGVVCISRKKKKPKLSFLNLRRTKIGRHECDHFKPETNGNGLGRTVPPHNFKSGERGESGSTSSLKALLRGEPCPDSVMPLMRGGGVFKE